MNSLFDIIGIPFQYVLRFFSSFSGNYAVAILIFTIIVNLAMAPLNVKQQKTMAKQARMKPKIDKLKEKYGDDRVKMSEAQQELYSAEKISPMGGCLPMVIRMLVLLGVYRAVYNLVAELGVGNPSFSLFGLDLSQQPHFSTNFSKDFDIIWIIPLLSFVANVLSMLISQMQQRKINPAMAQQGNSMFIMMLIMPIFSLVIAFQVQAAVGYYWIVSNVVNTGIQLVVNHLYSANKVIATESANDGLKRRQYEASRIGSKKLPNEQVKH